MFEHPRIVTILIVVMGGVAVLGSYIQGLTAHPDKASALWGGVPKNLFPLYTLSMLLAAAGYLLFTHFLLFRATPLGLQPDFHRLAAIYAIILIPSALWMPLTVQMVSQPSEAVWFSVRFVLTLVAIGAGAMVYSLFSLYPRPQDWSYWAALAGSIAFFFHTAVLDALIWPNLFQR